MTTLTPTQYNQLPESEKRYWKIDDKWPSTGNYTPVTINLCDAERVVRDVVNEMEHSWDSTESILTTALNQLKDLS